MSKKMFKKPWVDNKTSPQPEPLSPVICGPQGCCDELPPAPVSTGGPQGRPSCLGSWYFLHCQRCQVVSFLGSLYEPCLWTSCGGCWDRLQLVVECQPLWLGCGYLGHSGDVGLQHHLTVTSPCREGSGQIRSAVKQENSCSIIKSLKTRSIYSYLYPPPHASSKVVIRWLFTWWRDVVFGWTFIIQQWSAACFTVCFLAEIIWECIIPKTAERLVMSIRCAH